MWVLLYRGCRNLQSYMILVQIICLCCQQTVALKDRDDSSASKAAVAVDEEQFDGQGETCIERFPDPFEFFIKVRGIKLHKLGSIKSKCNSEARIL